MKKVLFLAALLAMLAGCATTAATTGSQLSPSQAGDDGAIKQTTEFWDLPAEMQQAIQQGA